MLIQLYIIDYKWVLDVMNPFLKYKYNINKRKEKLYLLERWIAFSLFVDVFLFSLMFIKVMIYLSE